MVFAISIFKKCLVSERTRKATDSDDSDPEKIDEGESDEEADESQNTTRTRALVDRKKRGRPKGSRGRSLGGPKRTKNEEDDPMKEKRGRKVKNG